VVESSVIDEAPCVEKEYVEVVVISLTVDVCSVDDDGQFKVTVVV
jgi:hypothetical protein